MSGTITMRINDMDLELIKEATRLIRSKKNHKKYFGYSSFIKEVALKKSEEIVYEDYIKHFR